jgi:hypothetical protein
VILVFLACVDPNPMFPVAGTPKATMTCTILGSNAVMMSEESKRTLTKQCILAPNCDEKRPGIFMLRQVAPAVVEKRI